MNKKLSIIVLCILSSQLLTAKTFTNVKSETIIQIENKISLFETLKECVKKTKNEVELNKCKSTFRNNKKLLKGKIIPKGKSVSLAIDSLIENMN